MTFPVLVVSTNRVRTPFPVPPISAAAVASAAVEAGFEVKFLDLMFVRRPVRALRKAIGQYQPRVVGLSVRNLDTTAWLQDEFYLDAARDLVSVAKESGVPVIVGGPAIGVNPLPITEYLGADAGVVGEGERVFVELLRRLQAEQPFDDLPGLVIPGGQAPGRVNDIERIGDLDSLPRPRVQRWIETRPYAKRTGPIQIQARRGCALRCTYCNYAAIEGREVRRRDTAGVVAELTEMAEDAPGVPIEFVDSAFNVPLPYTVELCRAIAEAELDLNLGTAGFFPGAISEELFDQMDAAGFQQVIITPDAASDTVLKRLKKGVTRAQLEVCAAMRRRAGFAVTWGFMVGCPGETEETLRETFEFIEQHVPEEDMVFLQLGVRVYPRTALHRELVDEAGLDTEAPLLEPCYYFSPDLPQERLREMVSEKMKLHPAWITAQDMENPMYSPYLRLITVLGETAPMRRGASGMKRLALMGMRKKIRF